MRIDLENFLKAFDSLFGVSRHREGNAEAIECGEVVWGFLENLIVEGDGLGPIVVNGRFDG